MHARTSCVCGAPASCPAAWRCCTVVAERYVRPANRRLAWFQVAGCGQTGQDRFPGEGELLMPQPIARRIAMRTVQLAVVAAGIFVVMLVFSRQAHAATSAPSKG